MGGDAGLYVKNIGRCLCKGEGNIVYTQRHVWLKHCGQWQNGNGQVSTLLIE